MRETFPPCPGKKRRLSQPIVAGTWRGAKMKPMLATLPQFSISVEREPGPAYSSFVNGGTAMEKYLNGADAGRWEWYAAGVIFA